ncbi:hypothetical protein EVAR_46175_1 [Eumeta japonica]|uniref:Histone-lysine N-methyltransferase SETMAR n=1 Tax=Eumeta variegata TaxID=151549 RepID=A0A4C1XZ14_EUMVA|nr:hypothetical protein EVAR_46175_1 [Eumeta japonica]
MLAELGALTMWASHPQQRVSQHNTTHNKELRLPDVKDEPRCGRSLTNKVDAILEKVEQDRHISSYNIAKELGINHKTVLTHLKKSEYAKKAPYLDPTRAH